jgi:3-phosphoglycerate kinase
VFVLGVFEMDAFAKGTYGVAATLAELTGKGCITIIGGGGETQCTSLFFSIPFIS